MRLVDAHLERVPESPLYHYTDAAGLIGILKNKSVWASSIQHLNDTLEYKHAVGMMTEELERRFDGIAEVAAKQPFGSLSDPPPYSIESLRMLRENLRSLNNTPLYIASFSEKKDVLSQWRGYCMGRNGYSMGFMPQTLTALKDIGYQLVKCVYTQEEKKSLCNALIDSYLELDAKFLGKRTLWRYGSKSKWRSKFSLLAAAIRHEGFQEESEWRLVGKERDENALHFRTGRSGVVPYLEVPLAPEGENIPVAELVIGPTDDRQASLIGAEKIMERYARRRLADKIIPRRSLGEPPLIPSSSQVDYLISLSATPYRN